MGSASDMGSRRVMEDAGAIVRDLMDLPLASRPGRWIVPDALTPSLAPLLDDARFGQGRSEFASAPGSDRGAGSGDAGSTGSTGSTRSTSSRVEKFACHFVGVFDGHGGPEVARQAAASLPLHVRRAFEQRLSKRRGGLLAPVSEESVALGLEAVADIVRLAFQTMDEELLGKEECKRSAAECVGSTAVVALISRSMLCVANCGDSRAVLSRGGVSYRLTRDHKPDLEDEQLSSSSAVVPHTNRTRRDLP
ncbi:unnamed protein product [Ostreobium quekettii]|uniref:protein-serine/threonine phosphatase n=1 Tax=Ostreobium quekettii TaxID=121088 RepID=A0A8S1IU22_9CHLO|nr:unnamed protein product [Ostreobium quekettii]|eukprot:evm.model.scf_10EXC.5 EVM.evm.TU.scf_10EXC.5   scf_10EXC:216241-219319(+)